MLRGSPKQDQSGQGEDLDQTEPELDLSESLDTKGVDSDDEDDQDGDPGGRVDLGVPESGRHRNEPTR